MSSVSSVVMNEVVSVVSHRGDVNLGHFVSYHKVQDKWYLNDDSSLCQEVSDPFLQLVNGETVEMIFFKSVPF